MSDRSISISQLSPPNAAPRPVVARTGRHYWLDLGTFGLSVAVGCGFVRSRAPGRSPAMFG